MLRAVSELTHCLETNWNLILGIAIHIELTERVIMSLQTKIRFSEDLGN